MGPDVFDLTGQAAIVTGAGTGIGAAIATLLADRGADLVLGSRRVENLERTAAAVEARGRRAVVVRTDVREPDDCRELVAASVRELGRLDVLVNNAGGSRVFDFDDWTLEEYENSMALNVRAAFLLSQAAAPALAAGDGGSIVNISSIASDHPMPRLGAYGVAKAGVEGLTRILAAQYGPQGVRVNAVQVGFVKSEGFVRAMAALGRDADEVGATSNSFGRAGEPDEVAYPVLFLVSGAASFVSGETLRVAGPPPVAGPW